MDFARLTERERQCLRLIGRAMSHKEVARELDLSDATVKEYLANARRKLGASTTREAARAFLLAENGAAPAQKGGMPERRDAVGVGASAYPAHAVGFDPRPAALSSAAHVADLAPPPPHGDDAARGAAGHRRTHPKTPAASLVPAAGHDLPRDHRAGLDRHERPRGARHKPVAIDWGGGTNDLGLLRKLGWAALIMIVSLMAYGGFTQGLRNLAATVPLFR